MRKFIKFTIGLPVLVIFSLVYIYHLIVDSITESDDIFELNIKKIKDLWRN